MNPVSILMAAVRRGNKVGPMMVATTAGGRSVQLLPKQLANLAHQELMRRVYLEIGPDFFWAPSPEELQEFVERYYQVQPETTWGNGNRQFRVSSTH